MLRCFWTVVEWDPDRVKIMVVVTEIEIDDDVDWVMMLGTGLDCDTRQGIFHPQLLHYYYYS